MDQKRKDEAHVLPRMGSRRFEMYRYCFDRLTAYAVRFGGERIYVGTPRYRQCSDSCSRKQMILRNLACACSEIGDTLVASRPSSRARLFYETFLGYSTLISPYKKER